MWKNSYEGIGRQGLIDKISHRTPLSITYTKLTDIFVEIFKLFLVSPEAAIGKWQGSFISPISLLAQHRMVPKSSGVFGVYRNTFSSCRCWGKRVVSPVSEFLMPQEIAVGLGYPLTGHMNNNSWLNSDFRTRSKLSFFWAHSGISENNESSLLRWNIWTKPKFQIIYNFY